MPDFADPAATFPPALPERVSASSTPAFHPHENPIGTDVVNSAPQLAVRILLLSYWNPAAPGGVSLRIQSLVSATKAPLQIDVVCLDFPPGDGMRKSVDGRSVEIVRMPGKTLSWLGEPTEARAGMRPRLANRLELWCPEAVQAVRLLRARFSRPWPPENFRAIVRPFRGSFHAVVAKKIAERPGFDVIDVDHVLAPWLPQCAWSLPRAVTFIDVVTETVRKSAGLPGAPARAHAIQEAAMSRFERKLAEAADVAIAVSEREGVLLQNLAPRASVVVVRNGLPIARYLRSGRSEEAGLIVFSGRMTHTPNIDAMLHFVREILPAIVKAVRHAHLSIVGADPDPQVCALEGPHVQVVGAVEDMLPWLERAEVIVAPLRAGGGTRLKILEALAMGAALVATPEACAGLEVTDGEHALVREPTHAFAEAVVKLMENPPLRERLGASGRRLVESRYSPEACVDEARRAYGSAIANAAATLPKRRYARMHAVSVREDRNGFWEVFRPSRKVPPS